MIVKETVWLSSKEALKEHLCKTKGTDKNCTQAL